MERQIQTISAGRIPERRLKETINLCCLYGIIAVALHLLISMVSTSLASHYVLFYLIDMAASLIASLLPALVLMYMDKGVKHYLHTPHRYKSKPLDSCLLVLFGLSGCMVANMVCTILGSYLPDVEHRVYLTFEGNLGNFLLMLTASAIIPAVCEEIPCRGYLYGSMAPYGHLMSVLLSSFIFGMLHSNFNTALFAFMCGFLFGCIRKTSNRFWLSVVVHFLNNALSTIGLFIRMNIGTDGYLSFLRTSSQVALFLFAGCIFVLYKRRVRVFRFRKCPFPLRKRDKLRAAVTSPVLWLFILAATLVKFL